MAIVRVQNQDGTISQVDDSTLSKPMPQKPGAIRALGDTLLKFGSGAAGATKAAIDALGPNAVSTALGKGAQALEGAQSDYAIAHDQIAAQRAQNAEGKGAVAEIGATLRNFIDRPVATVAQGAGSIVPTAAAMIASRGKINPAAAGIGLGAVQGAGAVKGSIYDAVKQDATAKGMTEQEADKLATDAQAYGGQNRDQIALGAGLGAVAGATGAEATSLLTGSARETAKSRLRETLKGFATEGGTEAAQGGQEQYAANVARNRLGAGIDPFQGVAGQATAEGIAGGVVGGAFSLADTFTAKEQLKSTILQQGNGGVISQAAATAVDTGAAQPMGLPNYVGEPLVTFPDGTTMTRAEAQAKYTADELAQFEQRVGMNQKPAVAGLLQTREANPMIVFADGSTGTKQQFDEYLAGLPNEAERMKSRARFLGYAPQQADATQEQTTPVSGLLQARDQDPMIVYPDGSTGKRSEFDGYINSLLEQQRVTEMARLLGYGPQQGGENATQQLVAEVAAQSGQEELANAQAGAGNELYTTGSGAGLGADAATLAPSMRGDISAGTQPRTGINSGNAQANTGVDTYVIRDKQTGDVIRATENPNERVSDAYELVPAKQHKQDVKAGKFNPVDLNSAQPGDVIDLNGVQWRKLDNGGFEQVMGEKSPPAVNDSLTTEQPTTEQSSAVDAKPNNDITANDAATSVFNELPEPTEAQKQAGNYKVGRMKVGGLDISVENPDQSMRTGKDPDGTPWETVTNGHYGYIKGVKARSPDKEHVDVNVKPGTAQDFAGDVFIVNQNDPRSGKFDEPKVYMGYADEAEAEAAYRSNYAPDWQGFGGITRMPMADFKAMLDDEKAFLKPVTVSQPTKVAQDGRQVQGQETAQEVTGVRSVVEAIVKRRAAANQIGKGRAFNNYLDKAKRMMAGETLPKNTFKLAQAAFQDDKVLADQFKQLDALMNKQPDMVDALAQGETAPLQQKEATEIEYKGVRISQIKVRPRNEGDEPRTMWAVETTENKERRLQGQRTIGGDALLDTIEEAKAEVDEMQAREKAKQQADEADARKQAEKEKADQEAMAKKSDLDGFGDDLPQMRKALLIKNMDTPISINGEVLPLRDHVRKLVAKGGKPFTRQENAVKGMTKRQYNQADNRAQAANDKRVAEGGKKTVYAIQMPDESMYELGKNAHDFAQYLVEKNKPASETVKVKDKFGRTHTVRKADLENADLQRIPTVRANGDVVVGEEIPRDVLNVDNQTREQKRANVEAEVYRQAVKAWDEVTGGQYQSDKRYPAKITVNDKTIEFALFKKPNSTVLRGERLQKSIYGYFYQRYEFKESGLIETGTQNFFGRDDDQLNRVIAEYNDIFGEQIVEPLPVKEKTIDYANGFTKEKPTNFTLQKETNAEENAQFDELVSIKTQEYLENFKQGDFKISYISGSGKEAETSNNARTQGYRNAAKTFLQSELETKPPRGKTADYLNLDGVSFIKPLSVERGVRVAKTPEDMRKAMKPIAGQDDIRYYINGIHFEDDGKAVATDGTRMIVVDGFNVADGVPPKPENPPQNGDKYTVLNHTGEWIDGVYVPWQRVFPGKHKGRAVEINAQSIGNYARGVVKAFKYSSDKPQAPFRINIDGKFTDINAQFIADMADAFRAFGYDKFMLSIEPQDASKEYTRIFATSPDGKVSQLVMPFSSGRGKDDPMFFEFTPDFKNQQLDSKPIAAETQPEKTEPAPVADEPTQEAAAVEEVTQAETTPLTLFDNAMEAYRNGTATVEEYKAAFDYVLNNEQAITKYLEENFTKQQLFDRGGRYLESRYKSEKKDRLVRALYGDMVTDFLLPGESGLTSFSHGFGNDRYKDVIRQVGGITQESLNAAMQRRQDAIKENAERRAERIKGMADPKTLEDFQALMREKTAEGMTFNDARMTLTQAQREQYDDLVASYNREQRRGAKNAQKTQVQAAVTTTSGDIVETKHTKTGEPLFVVKAAERVERETYNQWNATAKRMGGYYSSFRGNGAVPGFQFKSRENAEAFLKYLGGDVDQAKEAIQAKRDAYADDRSQTAVERLNEMADKLEADADEALNRDRKVNTARRAGMAARAEAQASENKALAITMRNIASAIESGKAKYLDAVRQKVQVELLQSAVSSAQQKRLREMYPSYSDYEKRRYDPPTNETADYADFPTYTLNRSDWARLGRAMSEIDGLKAIGTKILSVANDVTDSYLKFAKENIDKVSNFSRGDGKRAVFKSKSEAETAIARNGFYGKAIVLPYKRGENIIIDSPAAAKEKGVWQGDDDKRISMSSDFGKEIVEKIGRANRRTNKLDMPWQLEAVYDKRQKLARMDIETPAEYRAALREFIGLKETAAAPDKVKELERSMVGRRNDGLDFFPTPAEVADTMIDVADIQDGMNVLEPSAGMGHIAERIRAAGFDPDVVEFNGDRRELLELKGLRVVGSDFLEIKQRGFGYGDTFRAPDGKEGILRGLGGMGSQRVRLVNDAGEAIGYYNRDELEPVRLNGSNSGYDRIIMNPPFSNRRDEQHVRHAYNLLKPGGRIVAIMGEGVFIGSDRRATEFRDWLESVGGTSEKLPDGTFNDASLPVNTSANARMVVIDKAEDAPMFSRTQRSDLAPQSDLAALAALFTELETDKPLRKLVADRKVDKHPMADEIKRVDRDFYDIIGQLEDEGRLKINCKD